MTEANPPAVWRLPLALLLVAAGVVFARLGFRSESTIALTWAGAAVLAWVAATIPAGALVWRRPGGSMGQAVAAPVILGIGLGALLTLGGWLLSVAGLSESVGFVLAPAVRLPFGWVLLAVLAMAFAEELALRHGVFVLLPRPARILGTMALSVVIWLIIGNEVAALGAVVIGLATARQRYVTGGLLGPVITHVLTAGIVLAVLPLLVA